MSGFVPVESDTKIGIPVIAVYNSEIYYSNILDNGYLYKYNSTTSSHFKVLSKQASEVKFYNGHMYYSTHVLMNFAFYRMEVNNPDNVEKLSSDRIQNIIFDGNYAYYITIGVTANKVKRLNLTTLVEEEMYDKGIHSAQLVIHNNKLIVSRDPAIGYKTIHVIDINTKEVIETGVNGEDFVVVNNIVYIYNQKDKTLDSISFQDLCDKKNPTTVVTKVEIEDMI